MFSNGMLRRRLAAATAVASTKPRYFAAIVLTATFLVTLTACDSASTMHADDLEIQVGEDGALLVAVCSNFQAISGYGEVRDDDGGPWTPFWKAEGNVAIESGEVGRFGSQPFGLVALLDQEPRVTAGDRVGVQILPADSGLDLYVIFTIDDLEEVQGMWLDADGALSASPCS